MSAVDNEAVAKQLLKKGGATEGWQGTLSQQMTDLGRWIEGRLVVTPDPSDEIVPAERYLDADFLREAIQGASRSYMQTGRAADPDMKVDPRVAVSRFTRHYAASISIVALVSLARGVGLRLTPDRCRMIIRAGIPFLVMIDGVEDEMLRCAERPTSWPIRERPGRTVDTLAELREHVWRGLYAEHLAPLLSRILDVTKVAQNLMWSNAAEWVSMVSDAADEYLGYERSSPFVEDRKAVLSAERLPGLDGNPMRGLIEWEPVQDAAFPHGIPVRHVCCLTYMLPDRLGRLCQNCTFLSLGDRLALIKERHGVSLSESVQKGTPEGSAVAKAIDVGAKKLKLG